MRKMIDLYVAKRDCPGDEAYAMLSLPATPYELLDIMDRVRPNGPEELDYSVEEYRGCEFLAPYILPAPDLFALNALCEQLAELDERQAIAFHGLVQMEAQKHEAKLSMQNLLDLAYSAECCHVVDALSDSQLGRFYVDNDFFAEGDHIPEYLSGYLDYAKIGKEMREKEEGIFVQKSDDDPGGYVVRHSELKQAPPVPTELPGKPAYTFRLNVSTLPLRQGEHGRRCEILDFPASEEQIQETARKVGAGSLTETMAAVLDGPLACLKADIFFGEELLTINNLAQKVALLDAKGMLPKFKALQEATECTGLDQLMELTDQVDDYFFEPDKRSVEDVAMDDLQCTVGGEDSELMAKYMNLTGYGKALLERENGVVTHYGMLERKDAQPIQAQAEQEEQEPSQGGMEMM